MLVRNSFYFKAFSFYFLIGNFLQLRFMGNTEVYLDFSFRLFVIVIVSVAYDALYSSFLIKLHNGFGVAVGYVHFRHSRAVMSGNISDHIVRGHNSSWEGFGYVFAVNKLYGFAFVGKTARLLCVKIGFIHKDIEYLFTLSDPLGPFFPAHFLFLGLYLTQVLLFLYSFGLYLYPFIMSFSRVTHIFCGASDTVKE